MFTMKKLIPIILLLCIFFFANSIVKAQINNLAFAKNFGASLTDDFIVDIVADDTGNVYFTGYYSDSIKIGSFLLTGNGYTNSFVAKADAYGNIIWAKSFGGIYYNYPNKIILNATGNIFITGRRKEGTDFKLFLSVYSPNGTTISSLMPQTGQWYSNNQGANMLADELGNVYVVGQFNFTLGIGSPTLATIDGTTNNLDGFIWKVGPTGATIWAKSFGNTLLDWATALSIDSIGNIYVAGRFGNSLQLGSFSLNSYGFYDTFVAKMNPNGDYLWAKTFGYEDEYNAITNPSDIKVDKSGNIYLSGVFSFGLTIGNDTFIDNNPNGNNYTAFLAKLDNNGMPLWAKSFGSASINMGACQLSTDSRGNLIAIGGYRGTLNLGNYTLPPYSSIPYSSYITKIDPNGNHLWAKSMNYITGSHVDKFENFYICGNFSNAILIGNTVLPSNGLSDGYIAKFGDAFIVPSTVIAGDLYHEANLNCNKDSGEMVFKYKVVKATPGNYYGMSNAAGKYHLVLPLDTTNAINYDINGFNDNYQMFDPIPNCPSNNVHNVNTGTVPDTLVGYDFGYQLPSCHWLDVQLASNMRRRCTRNTTTLTYSNLGSMMASNANIIVDFPKYVVPVSSSIPWLYINDSTYQFNLGDVASGQSGTITIIDSVKCGLPGINGISQCTKATIYPVPNCPSANWNGAEIGIAGRCENGFVILDIFNKGTANMNDSIEYEVHIDSISVFSAKAMLNAGDTLHLQAIANGHSVHMYANQVAFHPTSLYASLTIESCSNDSTFVPSAYVNHFPLAQAPNSKTHCLPIISSFDPNDKQVFPMGFTANHIIAPGTALEYLIRFQNTGTDTAFVVTISDTLSGNLNPESFEMGAASHPYQLSMQTSANGKTALRWQFNQINLPDSNVYVLGSQGFVQFRMAPKDSLPLGTTVLNDAAIYFDFNPPVITNQTLITYDNISFTDSSLIGAVNIVPSTPTLIYPLNTAIDLAPTFNFDWTDASNATGYVIEYALLPDMSNAINTNSTTSTLSVNNLILGNTYYWRVKAQNGLATFSNWSGVYSFTIVAPLAAPALIYPAQLSANIPTAITFDWDDIANAIDYIITYDTSASFANAMIDSVSISEFATITLVEGTTYHWKVKAKDAFGFYSSWSSSNEFTTIQNVNAPSLIYPSNLSSNIPTAVTFDWNDVPFATWYQLEYDTDMNFTTAQGDTSTLSAYNVASNLNDLTTYYWRVKSFNGNSVSSAWSSTYSFTTDFTTGINQKTDNKILIYPNPVHDGIYITLAQSDDVQIEITDLSGRLMLSQKVLQQSNIYLPLNIAHGMYQLRIIGTKSNVNTKLIVK
jgi:uncharacterized repeat protein (TIGR01451 family)